MVESKFLSKRVTVADRPFHHLTYKEMKLIIESLDEDVKTQIEYNSSQMLEDLIKLADDQVDLESMTT